MKNRAYQPYIEYGQKEYWEKPEENILKYSFKCVFPIKFVPDAMEELVWICRNKDVVLLRPDKINGTEINAVGGMVYGVRADYGFSLEPDETKSPGYITVKKDMHPAAGSIICDVTESKGEISVTELSKRHNYTVRYIENIMYDAVSCSPKHFARVVRFQNVLGIMLSCPDRNNSEFIETLGYADQAHFQREFKQMTGDTPKQFMIKYKRILKEQGLKILKDFETP